MTGLLALAFGAGLLAPVNPCGFGLLPAVLTATTASPTDGSEGLLPRLTGGLRAGLALTVGFTGTFTAIGLMLTVGVRSVITAVPWIAAAIGAVLVLVGIAMLLGWHPTVRFTTNQPDTRQATSIRGLVIFGAGYAVASVSCTLAVLLAVIAQAAATDWIGVLAVFTAYAAGSALLLVTLSLFAALAATGLTRSLRAIAPYASRIAGALLALSGGYLLYYWVPPLLGGGRPADGGLAALSGDVATWISANQLPFVLGTLTLVLGTTAAIMTTRRAGTPTTATATPDGTDCCPPTTQPATPAESEDRPRAGRRAAQRR